MGEVLATVGKIKDGDYEGWYQSWYDAAERVRGPAQESADPGRDSSARWAFLRAPTYFE